MPTRFFYIDPNISIIVQVRTTVGFGRWFVSALCSLQKELDLHGLKRKGNPAILCAVKHASVQQRGYIAVNSLHVSANATGSLTN